jgi:hypothetical protein
MSKKAIGSLFAVFFSLLFVTVSFADYNFSLDATSFPGLSNIAYGNGTFVAVGDNGAILYSTDGMAWTQATSGTTNYIANVRFEGEFVAVGLDGVLLTSPDGITWTSRQLTGSDQGVNLASEQYEDIALGDGVAVLVTDQGHVWTETNGIWKITSKNPSGSWWQTALYGNGLFVVGGNNGALQTSTDGMTWSTVLTDITQPFYTGAYGNGTYIMVGDGGSYFSNDGVKWFPVSPVQLMSVAFVGDTFIGTASDGYVYTSPDGITWTKDGIADAAIYYLAPGESTMIGASPLNGNLFYTPLASTAVTAVPTGTDIITYSAIEAGTPLLSGSTAYSRPLAFGAAAMGENTGSVEVRTLPFAGPVDVYVALSAPVLSPGVFFLASDYTLTQTYTPWKTSVTTLDETILENYNFSSLPAGTYNFYVAITPPGSLASYTIWSVTLQLPLTPVL